MATDDFFGARLDSMIDMRHPLAVLATRMPWAAIEAALAPLLAHQDRRGRVIQDADLFGPTAQLAGAGQSNAGRPRLPLRLMVALLYLKHAFNLSDEELCDRWSENVVWQFFSGMAYYEPRLPCDATQIGRFRRVLGEAGVEQLLKSTIEASVSMGVVKKTEFERIIVDTTVQDKAIAHPTDSRLLEIARHKIAGAAKRAGVAVKQTFAKEGRELRRKAGGYAEPGLKPSSGRFVPGEGLGLRPNAACKATPSSSAACVARSSVSARSWAHSCAMCSAVWNQFRRALQGVSRRPWPSRS
jgi:transposase, IS5 family